MLDYLDRHACSLSPAPRLTVFALRLWAKALSNGRCPVAPLQNVLAHRGAPRALWPAHNLFCWTIAHAERRLYLGCPCCGRVGDDEALLLAAVFANDDGQRQAALSGLLAAVAVPRGRRLALELQNELSLNANAPAFNPDN